MVPWGLFIYLHTLSGKRALLSSVVRAIPRRCDRLILLRGAIVNRTYGIHKNLYIQPFLLTDNIWSYLLWSPVIVYIPASVCILHKEWRILHRERCCDV